MSSAAAGPPMTIALPVHNGADTVGAVIESVLAQSWPDLELVISDNASTDDTEDVCRSYAEADPRIVYQRHAANVGLLNNFASAAQKATGDHVRWIGDDDSLEPDYVSAVLEAFAEDPRRVLVSTQIVYVDATDHRTLDTRYRPLALASPDPVARFAELLRIATADFATLDPLYSAMRRSLANLPRKNMFREDQVFAARLALAGPWGHVAAPLATRRRQDGRPSEVVSLLGIPAWRSHVRALLQCQELLRWVTASPLDPVQRRRARAEILAFYARGKRNSARRGAAKIDALARRPVHLTVGRAP